MVLSAFWKRAIHIYMESFFPKTAYALLQKSRCTANCKGIDLLLENSSSFIQRWRALPNIYEGLFSNARLQTCNRYCSLIIWITFWTKALIYTYIYILFWTHLYMCVHTLYKNSSFPKRVFPQKWACNDNVKFDYYLLEKSYSDMYICIYAHIYE